MPDILLCVCVVEVGLGILFGFDLFLLSFYCLFFFLLFLNQEFYRPSSVAHSCKTLCN